MSNFGIAEAVTRPEIIRALRKDGDYIDLANGYGLRLHVHGEPWAALELVCGRDAYGQMIVVAVSVCDADHEDRISHLLDQLDVEDCEGSPFLHEADLTPTSEVCAGIDECDDCQDVLRQRAEDE